MTPTTARRADAMMPQGQALKELRKHKGWTQVQFAALLGTTQPQVSHAENTYTLPSDLATRALSLAGTDAPADVLDALRRSTPTSVARARTNVVASTRRVAKVATVTVVLPGDLAPRTRALLLAMASVEPGDMALMTDGEFFSFATDYYQE